MARPRKDTPLTQTYNLRMDVATLEGLRAKAADAGQPMSAYLREQIAGIPASRRRRKRTSADPALVAQVARVGNNLNQIAKVINRQEWSGGSQVELLSHLMRLVRIERELDRLLNPGERVDGDYQ